MKFLNTLFGSYVKMFLVTLLTFAVAKGDLFAINYVELISTAVFSFLPVLVKTINGDDGFFNTFWGGWLKSAVTIAVTYITAHGSLFGIDWHGLVNAVVFGIIPALINFLNPSDQRYGINKEA